jgi:hypothetical protein
MNRQEAIEFLPLIQALADGKTIQIKYFGDEEWITREDVHFFNPASSYRVKPEPREWILNVYGKGEVYAHDTMREALDGCEGDYQKVQQVRVREILD